jgi:hypothetical protein
MDFINFVLVYLSIVLAFVFVLLFGELTVFAGTPISFLNWLITSGICSGAE